MKKFAVTLVNYLDYKVDLQVVDAVDDAHALGLAIKASDIDLDVISTYQVAEIGDMPDPSMTVKVPDIRILRKTIARLVAKESKIVAIKLYRDMFGTGLKDSKAAVEKIADEENR